MKLLRIIALGSVLFFVQGAQAQTYDPKVVLKCTNTFLPVNKAAIKVVAEANKTIADSGCSLSAKVSYYDLSNRTGGFATFVYSPSQKIGRSRVYFNGNESTLLNSKTSTIYKYNGNLLSPTETIGNITSIDIPGTGVIQELTTGVCKTTTQVVDATSLNGTNTYNTKITWKCSAK